MRHIHILLSVLAIFFIYSCSKGNTTQSTQLFQLSTTASPQEAGNVTPAKDDYEEGNKVKVTASANTDWVFVNWRGDYTGTNNPGTVTMNSDKQVTGLFEQKSYTLNIDTEGEGSVLERLLKRKSADYEAGSVVELFAVEEDGWRFSHWGGNLEGTENPVDIEIDQEKNVKAVFVRRNFGLDIEIIGEGVVEQETIQSKSTEYAFGSQIKLKAVPDSGWGFIGWKGDLESIQNPETVTISEGMKITVEFSNDVPIIETNEENFKINTYSATLVGRIIDEKDKVITNRGFYYGKQPNPTGEDNFVSASNESSTYSNTVTNLEEDVEYHVRAFVEFYSEEKNATFVSFGNNVSFRTPKLYIQKGDGVTDIDGNEYETVVIGSQEWMAENLRTSHYSNGDVIPNTTSSEVGAWRYYDDDDQYEMPYGKLYNWYAVNDGRGLCPENWKTPSENQVRTLVSFLGGSNIAGGRMKIPGTEYWNTPNTGATNKSNFNAYPAGVNNSGIGESSNFWTTQQHWSFPDGAYYYGLSYDNASLQINFKNMSAQISVRCIKI